MTLYDVQALARYLVYALAAIQLRWVFCRRIWDFEREFTPRRGTNYRSIPTWVKEDLQ
jgi:hypothetical protein